MMKKLKKMSNTEKEFMDILWAVGEPLSLQDFILIFHNEKNKSWKNQTVSTFLARLVKKGYLLAYRKGRAFYYQPVMNRLEYKHIIMEYSLNKTCDSSFEKIIAYFCGCDRLERKKRKQLHIWLQELYVE